MASKASPPRISRGSPANFRAHSGACSVMTSQVTKAARFSGAGQPPCQGLALE